MRVERRGRRRTRSTPRMLSVDEEKGRGKSQGRRRREIEILRRSGEGRRRTG